MKWGDISLSRLEERCGQVCVRAKSVVSKTRHLSASLVAHNLQHTAQILACKAVIKRVGIATAYAPEHPPRQFAGGHRPQVTDRPPSWVRPPATPEPHYTRKRPQVRVAHRFLNNLRAHRSCGDRPKAPAPRMCPLNVLPPRKFEAGSIHGCVTSDQARCSEQSQCPKKAGKYDHRKWHCGRHKIAAQAPPRPTKEEALL